MFAGILTFLVFSFFGAWLIGTAIKVVNRDKSEEKFLHLNKEYEAQSYE